nr:hypothetical protein CFP56_74433 [Quercus suber]
MAELMPAVAHGAILQQTSLGGRVAAASLRATRSIKQPPHWARLFGSTQSASGLTQQALVPICQDKTKMLSNTASTRNHPSATRSDREQTRPEEAI